MALSKHLAVETLVDEDGILAKVLLALLDVSFAHRPAPPTGHRSVLQSDWGELRRLGIPVPMPCGVFVRFTEGRAFPDVYHREPGIYMCEDAPKFAVLCSDPLRARFTMAIVPDGMGGVRWDVRAKCMNPAWAKWLREATRPKSSMALAWLTMAVDYATDVPPPPEIQDLRARLGPVYLEFHRYNRADGKGHTWFYAQPVQGANVPEYDLLILLGKIITRIGCFAWEYGLGDIDRGAPAYGHLCELLAMRWGVKDLRVLMQASVFDRVAKK